MRLPASPRRPFKAFVTCDASVLHTLGQLEQWARNSVPMLITGEPGVGKSLVARLLHIANADPHTGYHVYGATDVAGVAHGWATGEIGATTLVVDELDRWPLARQRSLLARLPEAPVERLIVLSRVSAARLQSEGRVVAELAAKWADRQAHLPPLRSRPDDLPSLVEATLWRAGRARVELEPAAWRALGRYGWPDNVRELRAIVGAALARLREDDLRDNGRHPDHLRTEHFALDPFVAPSLEALADGSFDSMRRAIEAWYLRRLMRQAKGNISAAARQAGCSRKVLRDRLRRHDLYPPASAAALDLCEPCIAREGGTLRWLTGSPLDLGPFVAMDHAVTGGFPLAPRRRPRPSTSSVSHPPIALHPEPPRPL